MDESTDVSDTAQVLPFIQEIDKHYEATGEHISKGVEKLQSVLLLMVAKTCVEKIKSSLLSYQRP